jgi:tetratricopeptide (TPR) repeat protein
MAGVFLSYDHEDAARAGPIASALEKAGHSVWWDRHIHGGAEYNSEIEGAVERADVVVVLWSQKSVHSAWVRDEAAEGRDRGKLVPVTLDSTKPPMGFRQYQTIPLSEWRGRKPPQQIAELLHAVETIVGLGPTVNSAAAHVAPQSKRRRIAIHWAAAAAFVLVIFAIGLLLWRPWAPAPSALVAVSAADPSRASQDYARDLLAQLGQLQLAKPDTLQLVGEDARERPSFVFRVAGTSEGQQTRANLVLLDGKSGGLFWSKTFERPIREAADLRQELGYTAARVFECTVEAHPGGRSVLRSETLKLYLNGCADWSQANIGKTSERISLFRRVIAAAPGFPGAWAKLISAEVDEYGVTGEDIPGTDTPHLRQLRSDIAAARQINPEMPEAYLAEADLLPLNAFGRKLSLADRSIASNPDSALTLSHRSGMLFAVGRISDALDDARRAADLDPVSPQTRQNYIFSLAQAGRTQAALDELAKAERIWPGSSAIGEAIFVINLRYADPKVAWQMIQSGQVRASWIGAQSFLKARVSHKPEDIELALKDARAAYQRSNASWGHLVQTLSIFDREDELLATLLRVPIVEAAYATDITLRPAARELWRHPRSFQYAKRVGLLQYWQSSGNWPDFCQETDLPYDCKKEAAKYR